MTERISYARKDNAKYFGWTEDAGRPQGCMEGGVDICLIMPGPSPYEKSDIEDVDGVHGKWLDGTTNPEKIEAERVLRDSEIPIEYVRRLVLYTDKPYKSPERENSAYARILDEKMDGTASPAKLEMLKIVNTCRTDGEALEDYVENESRTLAQLQDLDVTDDKHWKYVAP